MTGTPWSEADDQQLVDLRGQGRSWDDIATTLQRTMDSCRGRYRVLPRTSPRQPTLQSTPQTFTLPEPAPEAGGPSLPEPLDLVWETFHIDTPGNWLILNDVHLPFHDKRTVELAVEEARRRNVVGVLLNGDILDSGEISNHLRHRELPRYVEEIQVGKQFLGWLRSRFHGKRIVYKEGNHEDRLERYVVERAPALEGLEGLDLPSFLHLRDHGIEWVNHKRVIQMGKLNVIHGHEYKGGVSTPVNPARGLYLKARSVALCGHFHRTSEHHSRNIRQQAEAAWSVGCACFLTPRWCPLNDWNLGFAFVHLGNDGNFEVENKRVLNGSVV